jgi:tetratricopeptide (TPR) repeat protein
MIPSDSDRPYEGEGDEPGELAWNEFDWERYFREQDEGLYRYLAFYEKLRSHPERIDEVARLLGWDADEARDDAGEATDETATAPGNDDGEPYTLHQNPVFIATRAIYLSLTRTWELIAGDASKVPQPLALGFLSSLHRSEQHALLAIQSLDLGDYTMAIALFKRALGEVNSTLALIDDKTAASHRALASYRDDAIPRLFDLREIWLRVIGECRDEIARQTEDVEDDDV